MGCGKTTIGKKLSKALQLPFIDLDTLIEKNENTSINTIFDTFGENYFRELERKYLLKVFEYETGIIATGGGTPCFFNNMELMNNSGFCIFLDVEIDSLVSRLIHAKTERPLIKGKSPDELRLFIQGMMQKRRPFYETARYILKGKEIFPEQVLELVRMENK